MKKEIWDTNLGQDAIHMAMLEHKALCAKEQYDITEKDGEVTFICKECGKEVGSRDNLHRLDICPEIVSCGNINTQLSQQEYLDYYDTCIQRVHRCVGDTTGDSQVAPASLGAGRKIRVLVVDDSSVIRKALSQMLGRDPDINVVGTANNGQEALDQIPKLKPDVVTLDIEMPVMDGVTALEKIMQAYTNLIVIMVSGITEEAVALTLKSLNLGAKDFIRKPTGTARDGFKEMQKKLIARIKALYATRERKQVGATTISQQQPTRPIASSMTPIVNKLVAIGISTGGPSALNSLIPQLPADLASGIVIVQHMPEKFTATLAKRLDSISSIQVREAQDKDIIRPGLVLVAPGNYHMEVKKFNDMAMVRINQKEPVNGNRPSVDVLFRSVAESFGSKAIGIIMTGMGDDGADAIGEIKKAGGFTAAQDEESSMVFGMPRVAIAKQNVDDVVTLQNLPKYIITKVNA